MEKIVVKSVTVVAVIFSFCTLSVALDEIEGELFRICPNGLKNPNYFSEATRYSPLDCVRMCSQTHECSGVNICPDMSGQFTCAMAEGPHQGKCTGLTAASQPSCYYAQRNEVGGVHIDDTTQTGETTNTEATQTTTEITCENGGTPNGDRCQCPIDKAGRTCQRKIRDCSEVYENGYVDGYYNIEPLGSTGSVEVKCEINDGTMVTFPLMSMNMALNREWNPFRDGWQNSLGTQPNYFIGLENLFHLLKQAEYDLHILFVYRENNIEKKVFAIYLNFSIGSEAESFELSMYASFDDSRSTAQNGFSMDPPIKFSANAAPRDEDRVCYGLRNGAGWYGENCTGYGLFGSNKVWPVSGADVTFEQVYFNLIRRSGFYDE